MRMSVVAAGLSLCLATLLVAPAALAKEVTLKNDTYKGGSVSLAVQGGFHSGESFGVILVPPSYPFVIKKVRVLIAPGPGGSPATKKYTITITQDTAGSAKPGTQLFKQDVNITSSTTAISEVDVSSSAKPVTAGHIRVMITQWHKATPSIVRDTGPRKAKRNFIHGNIGLGTNYYWLDDLALLGMNIPGNWIIRLLGETQATTPDKGVPTPDKGVPTPDKGVPTPDMGADKGAPKADGAAADKGGSGDAGASLGGEGQACFPNGSCNAGLTCLSKRCVKAPEPEDSGCAVASGSGGSSALLLLLLGLLPLAVRRRRR